ncbi:MAG: enoyl-CoA hydratase-related protein [Phycisphaerae bacterium]
MTTEQVATTLELTRAGHVATLRFNSPTGVITFHSGVLGELGMHVKELSEDASIRFVVLRGVGKTFVAGADIQQMSHFTEAEGQIFSKNGHNVFNAIEAMPQVTFAALNGHTLGGGCELAMACDFRIAVTGIKIGQPESRLGLMPGWGGTQRLACLVGLAAARKLMFSGDSISAEEAQRLGLVDEVVANPEHLDEALARWFKTLSAGSPAAVRRIKHALLHRDETNQFGLCFSCSDAREGIAAFIEKRQPTWTGKA